ncbi:DUF2157 domain-containing protein [Halorubrum sp. DTA98]|uniref:DUF2157 domain-containing protein n=1 Tax=Halorubrum sp. DTA98 TaxID=3402163 RepID=UPI003AAEE0B0
MDPDDLRTALHRWTDEELIDESTADRIRAFEDVESDPGVAAGSTADVATDSTSGDEARDLLEDRRLVVALALMGGALVAVGVGTFLLERWDSIPVAVRALVLVAVPVGAGLGGHRLADRAPRTAHGLWLLAALFAGVTLFQLADLAPFVDETGTEPWLWLAWTTVATAIALGIWSRPISALGTLLGLATLVVALAPENPVLVVGFYGGVVYAAGLILGDRATVDGDATPARSRIAATHRWLGGGFAVVALALASVAGQSPRIGIEAGTVALGTVAVVAAAVVVGQRWDDGRPRYATTPALAAPVGIAVAWTVGTAGVGDVAAALVALGCLLALLLALVVAAVGLREAALVNVATLGFVLGVIAFLAGPVVDVVSGPLALIAAGLVLLGVGLAAERGRREVLARIR